MYIVLDSNIWLSELGLNTAKGAATRFYVKQRQAKLALPEVIKEEVERNLFNSLLAYSYDIQKRHRQLLSVFGQLKEVVLPSDKEIEAKAYSLFENVKVKLHHIPFSIESAKSSLRKINDKQPPSDKNQQFKDGVIWADCCKLLQNEDVILVTEDKAFYKDRNYKDGLAKNLEDEANDTPNKLKIYPSLSELMDEIKSDIDIDRDYLVKGFTAKIDHSMKSILERNGFAVSSDPDVKISSFVTENPDKLYIEFTIEYQCIDTQEQDRTDGILLLKGDGYYSIEDKSLTELRNRGEELSFNDGSEERRNVNHVIGVGNIVLGHRDVEHSIRHRIE
jgi:hypothetical protein